MIPLIISNVEWGLLFGVFGGGTVGAILGFVTGRLTATRRRKP